MLFLQLIKKVLFVGFIKESAFSTVIKENSPVPWPVQICEHCELVNPLDIVDLDENERSVKWHNLMELINWNN